MQQDAANEKGVDNSNNELWVKSFTEAAEKKREIHFDTPQDKKELKELLLSGNKFIRQYEDLRDRTSGFLSTKISMYDVEFVTNLIMVAHYGNKINEVQEKLKRLDRLVHLYEPKKKTSGAGVSDVDIEKAKQFPIKELVKVGHANNATCVWHSPDRHPSMHVYPDNHAHCFSCGNGGDVIDVVMEMNGFDFVEAVKYLNRV